MTLILITILRSKNRPFFCLRLPAVPAAVETNRPGSLTESPAQTTRRPFQVFKKLCFDKYRLFAISVFCQITWLANPTSAQRPPANRLAKLPNYRQQSVRLLASTAMQLQFKRTVCSSHSIATTRQPDT